ncbi:MAG: hypothetical protein ACLQVD_11080 [Capsulimonadaceae bacterium]
MRPTWNRLAPLLPMVLFPFYYMNAIRGHDFDDPYITYRYAQNLAAHHGFVYNPGLRLLSTTTPLYTLLCSILSKITANLPLASDLFGSFCLLLGACIFIDLLPQRIPLAGRVAAGVLLGLMQSPLKALGSEIPLYTLFILGTCWCYERDRLVAAGFLSGMATFTRPDGFVTFLALMAAVLARRRRADALRSAVAFAVPMAPWIIFATLYFGSPIPVTLAAKRYQAHVEGGYGFLRGLLTTLNFVRKDFGNIEFVCIALLVLMGIYVLVRRREIPLLILWAALYITGYSVIGVRYYSWYYDPLFGAGIWLVAVGLHSVCGRIVGEDISASGVESAPERSDGGGHYALRKESSPEVPRSRNVDVERRVRLATGLAVLIVAPMLYTSIRLMEKVAVSPSWGQVPMYRRAGEWLTEHSRPDATVGALQVGVIGYYAHRPIIDFAGLIEPDIAHAPGNHYTDWAAFAIHKYWPDYIALDSPWGDPLGAQLWFQARYHRAVSISEPGYLIWIYQRAGPRP